LGAALAIALMPVLLLGAVQSVVAFRRDAEERRTSLIAAAERSATVTRARMQAAEVLLETLNPETVGDQCSRRLGEAMQRSKGLANLIRLDAAGRVTCAAGPVQPDPARARSDWFAALRRGETTVVARVAAGVFAPGPAALMAVSAAAPGGGFGGALVAVTPLDELKPDLTDRSLPPGTAVALADRTGHYLLATDRDAFAPVPAAAAASSGEPEVFRAKGGRGDERVYAVAPLLRDVTVVLSAPDQGLYSWARLNPLTSLMLPIAAFAMALACVWVAADRVIVRWLAYLDRIAAIYARGRFTVRPLQAERAPPEVRALAHTLDVMAETIAGRDQALRDNLAQKDALMREIHHRVKNNLQVITSLLNMQQRSLADPSARQAMSDTRQRIGALALIYRALYQGPDLKRVDLRSFLEELMAQVLAAESGHGPALRTDLEADDLVVDPDKLAPIALFAVEAISNAQKHAFGPEGGALHVRFTLEGEEGVLEISDEGGRGPVAEPAEGVGRTLMTAFARQLRGRAELAANARGGMTARLVFPAPEAQVQPRPPRRRRDQAA
jgi:two-component sensor histidine kinase